MVAKAIVALKAIKPPTGPKPIKPAKPVKNGLASSNTVVNQASWIESVKNPPAPTQVSKALPF